MPAVQLAQLKKEINALSGYFTRPPEFTKALHSLLEHYSNRGVYRPGKTVQPIRQINTYYTASLIIREIEKELIQQTKENPSAALILADALWEEDFIELRELSATLLGWSPVDPIDPVIDRLDRWVHATQQSQAISGLLQMGTIRLRREAPNTYLELIKKMGIGY